MDEAAFMQIVVADTEPAAGLICTLRAAVFHLWRTRLKGRELEQAMREVDQRTQALPFRVETPQGPLFALQALWRFAGRPGISCWDELQSGARLDRPSWDGDWRRPSRDLIRSVLRAKRAARAAKLVQRAERRVARMKGAAAARTTAG
jgi:hypothetical protein